MGTRACGHVRPRRGLRCARGADDGFASAQQLIVDVAEGADGPPQGGRSIRGTAGLAAGLLVLFQAIAVLSSTQVVLNLPIAVQEMVLAVWLIVKGFSPKPEAKASAQAPEAAELHPASWRPPR